MINHNGEEYEKKASSTLNQAAKGEKPGSGGGSRQGWRQRVGCHGPSPSHFAPHVHNEGWMVDGREERRQRKARAAAERALSARRAPPAPTQRRPSAGTVLGSGLMGRLSPKLGTSYPHFTDKKLETQADVLTCSGPNPTQASRSPCRPTYQFLSYPLSSS